MSREWWSRPVIGGGFCVMLVLVCAPPAMGEVTVPYPKSFITDLANIIEPTTQRQLEGWLAELNQKTGAFVLVLTVPTTDGESLFDFVHRHAELWDKQATGTGIGVVICVTIKEREARIHTSYGLEHILPDSWCGSVSRNQIAANFKRGDANRGMYEATVAVATKIAQAKKITLTGIPNIQQRRSSGKGRGLACGGGMPFFILLMVVGSAFGRNRRYGAWRGGGMLQGMLLGSILGSSMRGGRSSWGGGGGGFGGGGFGGFGGGGFGGGGFGGGGGGASW